MRHCVTRSPGVSAGSRPPWRTLLVLVALAALTGVSSPAAAHDTLVGSDPADGTVLGSAPTQIVLTFSGDQLALGAAVTVTGPDGASATAGDPVVAGPTVTQALAADLAPGAYTAQWRSVSGDGHPIEGTVAFTVEAVPTPAPSEVAPAAPSPTTTPSEQAEQAEQVEQAGPVVSTPEPSADPQATRAGAWQWLVAGLVVLLVAGAAITVAVRRQGMPE